MASFNFTGSDQQKPVAMASGGERNLDRICTHVLAFESNSQVRWFQGNFTDEALRRMELGAAADRPHRIKYKPLVR